MKYNSFIYLTAESIWDILNVASSLLCLSMTHKLCSINDCFCFFQGLLTAVVIMFRLQSLCFVFERHSLLSPHKQITYLFKTVSRLKADWKSSNLMARADYSCIMCHWSIGQCGLHITWLQWSNSGPSPAAVLSTTWPIRSWHPLESWTSTVNIRVMWSSASFPPKSNVKVWANLGLTVFFFTRVFFFATRRFAENSSTLTYGSGNWNNSNSKSEFSFNGHFSH